jgi:diguanylate cyclase
MNDLGRRDSDRTRINPAATLKTDTQFVFTVSACLAAFSGFCLVIFQNYAPYFSQPYFYGTVLASSGLSTIMSTAAIRWAVNYNKNVARSVSSIEAAAFDRAMRDPLTHLYNRSGFKVRLEKILAERKPADFVGVAYIDLDKFKEVNDGYGHDMGDKLLISVAERLRNICGAGTTIARLGGDEFALAIENKPSIEALIELSKEISLGLAKPFILDGSELQIGGSTGLVVAPEDGSDYSILVRRADIAMYRVKAAGRGQAMRFDNSMEDDIRRRRFLNDELKYAIAREQLQILYQPCMASDGETLVGVEALLRWNHPEEGVISPAVFIPIAEESGLIVEIGEWVMRNAMIDALDWREISIAINVSPVQFRRKDLLEKTLAIIAEVGIAKHRVEIEITEGVLIDDADAAVTTISGFRNEGIHVALDDFGTGFASLSYLRRFPFDKLKVDQAFVRNLGVTNGSAAIIHSVVALGRSLGMTVHAEGVETLEHHIFLRAAGCHHFQGYYFGRPMPKIAIDALVEKNFPSISTYNLRA